MNTAYERFSRSKSQLQRREPKSRAAHVAIHLGGPIEQDKDADDEDEREPSRADVQLHVCTSNPQKISGARRTVHT